MTRKDFSMQLVISGRLDRASAIETSTLVRFPTGKSTDYKNCYSQLPFLTFSRKRIVKFPPCVVDRWAGGSLTRRWKGPFAVFWPRQLVK